MRFSQLEIQQRFFARGKVYKKVSSNLGADIRHRGDGCVEQFAADEDVESLTDANAENKLKELATARENQRREEQGLPPLELEAPKAPETPAKAEVSQEEEQITAAEIRKMKRDELDALAEEYGIDLEGSNVEESKEILVEKLCTEEANAE